MARFMFGRRVAACGIFTVLSLRPVGADYACEDAKTGSDQIARMLSSSVTSA